MKPIYDIIIKNGRFFDGSGDPSSTQHLGIRDGRVITISEVELDEAGAQVIDAAGQWVMPGFIDTHTHYDAELLVAPGLGESVRHGVTTVITGSCSLSMVYTEPLDAADLYSRVEALPYKPVLKILERERNWNDPESWIQGLQRRALGPNVASMVGHSDIRAVAMGLDRSTNGDKPTPEERNHMVQMVEDAMEAGFVGMSSMTNPWDRLAGDRFRSRALPSTYASWREYGWLHDVLRRTGRVLQSSPNLNTKVNMVGFFFASAGLFFRKRLKTTLISAADPKASPLLSPLFGPVTRLINWILQGQLKWQALPCSFEMYADGIDLVVFEEFGSGAAAMHLADEVERNHLLQDEAYRRRFRRDFEAKFSPRVWHRDFYDAHIVACPQSDLVGLSVGEVAEQRNIHPCDAFLDLVVAHGERFRWKTTIANHRPEILRKMIVQPSVQIGFADSGAHLRNMGFYNFGLHLLRMAQDAESAGDQAFLSIEEAVNRLTGEPAEWFDLDAGHLAEGVRADIVIVDPGALDSALDGYHEAPMPKMDMSRMVRRNDRAVTATIIGGRVAFELGHFSADFGLHRYGRFLRAGRELRDPVPQGAPDIAERYAAFDLPPSTPQQAAR
jgi:N-acyl-D-aspartate/D-glutamate deacylase